MRSVEYAQAMGKEIYVLPQRLGESSATNSLLASGKAKAIYDIDAFVALFSDGLQSEVKQDSFFEYLQTNPSYDEAIRKFPQRVFEAELNGEIEILNGNIVIK